MPARRGSSSLTRTRRRSPGPALAGRSNFGDVTAVNWAQVDPVDILTAGGDLMLPSAVQAERFGAYQAAVGRWAAVIGRPAPDPTVPGKNGPRLSARFASG